MLPAHKVANQIFFLQSAKGFQCTWKRRNLIIYTGILLWKQLWLEDNLKYEIQRRGKRFKKVDATSPEPNKDVKSPPKYIIHSGFHVHFKILWGLGLLLKLSSGRRVEIILQKILRLHLLISKWLNKLLTKLLNF